MESKSLVERNKFVLLSFYVEIVVEIVWMIGKKHCLEVISFACARANSPCAMHLWLSKFSPTKLCHLVAYAVKLFCANI